MQGRADRQCAAAMRFGLVAHPGDDTPELVAGFVEFLGEPIAGQTHPSPHSVGGSQEQRGLGTRQPHRAIGADSSSAGGVFESEPKVRVIAVLA
jgi:hypothetical protein